MTANRAGVVLPAEPSLARQDVLQMRSAADEKYKHQLLSPCHCHFSEGLLSWKYLFISSNEKSTKQLLSSTVEVLQPRHLITCMMAGQTLGEGIV